MSRAETDRERVVALEALCLRLLAAYEAEETEHGFPFNIELRNAHRDLRAALGGSDGE